MNSFEMLQAKVGLLEERLRRLEVEFGRSRAGNRDEAEAQRVAQELGFTVDVLTERKRIKERRRLAQELRSRRWAFERIGRVMNCSWQTVRRNFSRGHKGAGEEHGRT